MPALTLAPRAQMHGLPIDRVLSLDQSTRDDIARRLLRLTMRELFEWRFMQTDPNWGNFLYDPATDVIALLDFGAAREFPLAFVRDYMRIVTAAADRDEKTMVEVRWPQPLPRTPMLPPPPAHVRTPRCAAPHRPPSSWAS